MSPALVNYLWLMGILSIKRSLSKGLAPSISLITDAAPVPSSSEDLPSYVISSGTSVVFRCAATHPVTISFPENQPVGYERFANSTAQNSQDGSLYVEIVTATPTSGLDTGFVECVYANPELQLREPVRLYIYVEDSSRPGLPISTFITGFVGHFVVLPCRPTSPNVSVTFETFAGRITRLSFDPTLGYTISNLGISNSGQYICRYKDNSNDMPATTEPTYLRVTVASPPARPRVGTRIMGSSVNRNNFHEGQNVSVLCSISSDGSPVSLDFTDPEWILPRSRWQESATFGSPSTQYHRWLNITDIQISDMNQSIACSSLRAHHSIPRNVSIVIYETAFLQGLGMNSATVQEGSFFLLHGAFQAVGEESLTYHWTFNGSRVCGDDEHAEDFPEYSCGIYGPLLDSINYEIELTGLGSRGQHGLYVLTAMSGNLTSSLEASLTIHYKPDLVGPFSVLPRSSQHNEYGIVVKEKVAFTLGCTAESRPPATIYWAWHSCEESACNKPLVNSTEWIEINETLAQTSGAQNQVLGEVLPNTPTLSVDRWEISGQAEESGFYRCTASNAYGSVSSISRVFVSEIPKFFGFNPEEVYRSFYAGEPLDIACYGQRGVHVQPVIFVKNGSDLIPAVDIQQYALSYERTNRSFITRIRLESPVAGRYAYECIAEAADGSQQFSDEIFLVLRDIIEPEIISQQLLEVNTTMVNGSANFTCFVRGYPYPSVTWYKDGQPLSVSPSATLSRFDSVLSIYALRTEDAGNYTCEASSPYGSASLSGQLIVEGLTTPTNKGVGGGTSKGSALPKRGEYLLVTLVITQLWLLT